MYCILFSVVFTPVSFSHHGNVWLLHDIFLLLTNIACAGACLSTWLERFCGPKKKYIVPLCSPFLIHQQALLPVLYVQASLSLKCHKLTVPGFPYNLFLNVALTLALKKKSLQVLAVEIMPESAFHCLMGSSAPLQPIPTADYNGCLLWIVKNFNLPPKPQLGSSARCRQ